MPLELVSLAKRDELTEMYRESVWTEIPTSSCTSSTGKPPIPVHWAITNKGDKKNDNLRAGLVAKHIVAKYGGTRLHELFVAMPPFEMVKLLLIKAVKGRALAELAQRGDRPVDKPTVRKVMFIDVSKANLYALINADIETYCGRLSRPHGR